MEPNESDLAEVVPFDDDLSNSFEAQPYDNLRSAPLNEFGASAEAATIVDEDGSSVEDPEASADDDLPGSVEENQMKPQTFNKQQLFKNPSGEEESYLYYSCNPKHCKKTFNGHGACILGICTPTPV